MDSRRAVSPRKAVSDCSLSKAFFWLVTKYSIVRAADKIGGGYFLKQEPERYFEQVLQRTDFISEPRELNGCDVQESVFADSFGALNQQKPGSPENVVVTASCTLDEFYNGSIKQVEFQRRVV